MARSIEKGARFPSWDEFFSAVTDYSKLTFQPLIKSSSKLATTANKKKEGAKFPEEESLKYASFAYACTHRGTYKPQGEGKRKFKSFKDNCPAKIHAAMDRDTKQVVIRTHITEHNHPIGPDIYSQYTQTRLLSKEEEAQMKDLMGLEVPSKVLRNFVRAEYGKNLKLSDIRNIKTRSRNEMPSRKRQSEFYERLILEVQARDSLYNTHNPLYKDRTYAEKMWSEVSELMGIPVGEAKKTWAKLRRCYIRSINSEKMAPRDSGAAKKQKWYLSEKMSFFREHVQNGGTLESLRKIPQASELASLECDVAIDGEFIKFTPPAPLLSQTEEEEPIDALETSPTTTTGKRRTPPAEKLETLLVDLAEIIKKPKLEEGDSETMNFFTSLLPSFRALSSRSQRKLKLRIMQLVDEYVDAEEENNTMAERDFSVVVQTEGD